MLVLSKGMKNRMPMDWGLARDYAARDGDFQEMRVTEAEWLACDNPSTLLKHARYRSSARKSRLFAVACCRLTWHLLIDERSRKAVEVAERFADGAATEQELGTAGAEAARAHNEMFDTLGKVGSCLEWAAQFAAGADAFLGAKSASWMVGFPRLMDRRLARPDGPDSIRHVPCTVVATGLGTSRWKVEPREVVEATGGERPIVVALLRCVFRNRFRPASAIEPAWLAWRDGAVTQLARSVYEDRRLPEGTLDPARLALLADALEDAGCADAELLGHLRSPGPHVRGCWAVDLVLGKS
jgi:hypothetical protein